MFKLTEEGFVDGVGNAFRQITCDDGSMSEEWVEMQKEALDEYEVTHKVDHFDPLISPLLALFKHFVGSHVTGRALLDVGCGMYPTVPDYIAEISKSHIYVGLDPTVTKYDREYFFINSCIENAAKEIAPNQFDSAVFCTSLDHFESIPLAAEAIKTLVKADGNVIFFVGIHDRKAVASMMGASTFVQLFHNLDLGPFLWRYVKKVLLGVPNTFRKLRARDQMMRSKIPLDKYHFHYFTLAMLKDTLTNNFGEIEELIVIPNTNAVFASCRIGK